MPRPLRSRNPSSARRWSRRGAGPTGFAIRGSPWLRNELAFGLQVPVEDPDRTMNNRSRSSAPWVVNHLNMERVMGQKSLRCSA